MPELFLYASAVLLRRRLYEPLAYLLSEPFSANSPHRREGLIPYSRLQRKPEALERYYQDEGKGWLSPTGAMMLERADRPGISFDDLMQADLVLALRSEGQAWSRWWPGTLPYSESRSGPFEVFQRAASRANFAALCGVIGVATPDELRERTAAFGQNGYIYEHNVYIPGLVGADQIATQP